MNVLDILRYSSPVGWLYNLGEMFFKKDDSFIGRMLHGLFDNPNPMEYITHRGDPNKYDLNGNVIGSVNDPSSGIQDYIDSYLKTITGSGPNGLQLWQAGREDSAYQRGVADMEKAGLNPALMYGNGAQPSASSAGSGSNVGISDLLQLAMLPSQIKNIEAQTANVNASTKKVEEETAGVHLDNEFKDNTLEARSEGERLANTLKRSQVSKINAELDEIAANTRKLYEEAETEESRRALNYASEVLERVNAYTAVELLPYSLALAEAQTEAQRNYAALMAVQKLYQSKLITGGYVTAICEQMKASATSAEAQSAVDQINSDIRSGKFGNDGSFLGKVGSSLLQGTVLALDQLRGIASVGVHFGKSLNKAPKSPDVNPGYNYDPFGYLAGE